MSEAAAWMAEWVAQSPSAAVAQRSLGDPERRFPLWPPLLRGCPATSTADMQYPLDIDYDDGRIDALRLFADPPLPGLGRWAPLLPPLAPGLSLGEGGTPLVAASPRLREWSGCAGELLLKDESHNPTWSHKDRLNLCIVSAALATGAPGVAVASSGNHGASAAAYAARAGLQCVVVTSPSAQPAFRHFLAALGARVVLAAAEERWPVLNRLVAATGFMPASNLTRFHTGHPFGPEGYKTIAYEIFLQLGRRVPGTVIVPTGYGELLYGLSKGFRDLTRHGLADDVPRLCSAEPAVRGPLHRAVQGNAAAIEVQGPASLAAGIAATVGGYRGVLALRDGAGRALLFSEESVRGAAQALARDGLWQEYSGAAALAALREACRAGERFAAPVVAILTSSGLKEIPGAAGETPAFDAASLDRLIAALG
ncbi:MAG TPA: pyridoxal-phosphate dependent enzyme [Stellaceae bacterium]|nr:pyridoxal-phosphate dependent enzyme [Stellaceae bacterium]